VLWIIFCQIWIRNTLIRFGTVKIGVSGVKHILGENESMHTSYTRNIELHKESNIVWIGNIHRLLTLT
jgi:hypothetical protein